MGILRAAVGAFDSFVEKELEKLPLHERDQIEKAAETWTGTIRECFKLLFDVRRWRI